MKILVLGSQGQLGQCLRDQLENTDNEVIYTSRDQIDIADFESTKKHMVFIAPDIVINATAYTAVDKAEEHQETADLINHLAVANIADICFELDCWLIHISTDYVFDGNSNIAYKEDDKTNPQGVYGATKLRGELAIQRSLCDFVIIRTAWVFSEYGNNFMKTMIRLGCERDELAIVGDQIGCPTYAPDLAAAIINILPRMVQTGNLSGVYHFCGNTPCSWFDFASDIFSIAKPLGFKVPQKITSILTSEFPTPAHRPKYSVLDNCKIKGTFGIDGSDWRTSIPRVLQRIIKG